MFATACASSLVSLTLQWRSTNSQLIVDRISLFPNLQELLINCCSVDDRLLEALADREKRLLPFLRMFVIDPDAVPPHGREYKEHSHRYSGIALIDMLKVRVKDGLKCAGICNEIHLSPRCLIELGVLKAAGLDVDVIDKEVRTFFYYYCSERNWADHIRQNVYYEDV
jgi:hypothetical protein